MNDIKLLRDKLNGSLPFEHDENDELLLEQWNQLHAELEALKENDERNYIGFEK